MKIKVQKIKNKKGCIMTIHPKRNTTTTFGNTSFRKYKKRKDKNKKNGKGI